MVLITGLGFGLALGCNDGGSGDSVSAYVNKLQACGLLSEGELPSVDTSELDAELRCFLDCATRASCEELTALTCDPDMIDPSPELVACYEACAGGGEGNFVCADGSGSVPGDWECDGEPDCEDGSDELGCPSFTCADGSGSIPEDWRCDGFDDCDDGSDEQSCPTFACADGTQTVPADWQCDGEADCEDGSDELGCPGFFACADGSGGVPEEGRCNGELNCEDGSDEAGCPTYVCANGEEVVNGARCDLSEDCEDGSDEAGCAQIVCPMP